MPERPPKFSPLKNDLSETPLVEDFGFQDTVAEYFLHTLAKLDVPLSKETFILDVGTGLGVLPQILKQMGYMHAFGHDIVQRGKPGPEVLSRIETLPFANSSIDIINASSVFDLGIYNQDQSAMLNEIERVLKPGGIFFSFANSIAVPFPPSFTLIQGDSHLQGVYRKSEYTKNE